MSKTTTRDGLDVNPAIAELADALKKNAIVDDTGKIVADKGFYETTLPEGVDLKTVRKLQEHHSNLVAASELAVGELGVPYLNLKKHKDIDLVSLRIPVGRDRIDAFVRREAQVRNVSTGETSTVFGQTRSKYRTFGTTGTSGGLKATRQYVAEMASKVLG